MTQVIKLTLILLLITSTNTYGQTTKEEAFSTLSQLVGGTWTYEGKWENGEPFKQQIKCMWGLNKQIIKVQTYGVINREAKTYGLRNEGVRAWDTTKNKMKFYEFDVFGGVSEGYCVFEEGQFHYEYFYEVDGKQEIFRDTWRYIDKNTYQFKVSMQVGEGWKVYTTNEYKRVK